MMALNNHEFFMRYFLYASATKIEMLHSQIGISYFGKVKAGFKLKLGFAEASIGTETQPRVLYNKAEEIRNYLLSKSMTGTISQPKSYIDDVADLSVGLISEYASSIAFFGGIVGSKKVALIGASSSLVGAVPSVEANHAPFYYTMRFINEALEAEESFDGDLPYVNSLEEAVDIAQKTAIGPPIRVAFTASVLHDSPHLLVATPIFVTRVD
jgi:hypothetical protein